MRPDCWHAAVDRHRDDPHHRDHCCCRDARRCPSAHGHRAGTAERGRPAGRTPCPGFRPPRPRRGDAANLAGLSESYYRDLGQGVAFNASPQVLDPVSRTLFTDWEAKVRDVAAAPLRLSVGAWAEYPRLVPLIGELSVSSQEFAKASLGKP
ncbi:MmyB family transcriptional regulator [Streptomyces sp. 8N616]|uniref:MmyB family transcriptional regulator n=1 Tax=Streptomyces sp. 8N616 TaxID=3457414 RepID=UPI003FD66FAA